MSGSGQFNAIYRGLVSSDSDPEGLFRLKAIVPQVFGNDTTETDWAWPCFPLGLSGLPAPGGPVWIQFVDGDLDYPVWAGTWQPSYSLPTSPGPVNSQVPIGGSLDWWSDTLPTGAGITWVFMHGQTIAGGVSTFSALASTYPNWIASNGVDLNVPDTRGRYMQGAASVGDLTGPIAGASGGVTTPTLTTANIPLFNSVPVTVSVSLSGLGHSHSGSTTDDSPFQHAHHYGESYTISIGLQPGTSSYALTVGNSDTTTGFQTINHTHAISSDSISGASAAGSGHVTFGQASPTPIPQPRWVAAHKIVRAA